MDEYETVSGLIFDIADKIPEVGEEYIYDGYKLIIVERMGENSRK